MPLAYFLTFTTYGTWLHGSAKGRGSVDLQHNAYGTPYVAPDPLREQAARSRMVQPPYVMTTAEREVVCRAIVELCRERGWRLLAAHVRTNHVHVVLAAERDPGRLLSDLKARASRDLSRAGYGSADRRRWTRHGSTRYLFHETDVTAKVHYTLDGQGERLACYSAADHHEKLRAEPRTQ